MGCLTLVSRALGWKVTLGRQPIRDMDGGLQELADKLRRTREPVVGGIVVGGAVSVSGKADLNVYVAEGTGEAMVRLAVSVC